MQAVFDLALVTAIVHIAGPTTFFAALYNFAAANGFSYILNGGNFSTECVREPLEWHYHASDLRQLKDGGDVGSDDEHRGEVELQKLTDGRIAELDALLKGKEAEIMEV